MHAHTLRERRGVSLVHEGFGRACEHTREVAVYDSLGGFDCHIRRVVSGLRCVRGVGGSRVRGLCRGIRVRRWSVPN